MTHDTDRRTRVSAVRETFADQNGGETSREPVGACDGRVLAADVDAPADVPAFDRAATDGYAVRAENTFTATDRAPAVFRVGESVEPNRAVPVRTGERLPADANAVLGDAGVDRRHGEVEAFETVTAGTNVEKTGETVTAGETLVVAGTRLRPSHLGLCRVAGVETLPVVDRPTLELVASDDSPAATLVARLADRWGAAVTRQSSGETSTRATSADCVVGVGPDAAATVREDDSVRARRLAVEPGGETAVAVSENTVAVAVPSAPVGALVAAVVVVRPAIRAFDNRDHSPPPGCHVQVTRKLRSTPGVRTFVPVVVESSDEQPVEARPLNAAGTAGPTAAANADRWVAVPEAREGLPAGRRVVARTWEGSP